MGDIKKKKEIIVATSGGFDPVHIGHVRMFQEAKKLGTKHVVILNNDNWLMAKKGAAFMPQRERKEILEALACVDEVIITRHGKQPEDMSVAADLRRLRPDIFCNGGDRKTHNTPEDTVCKELGIAMAFNVGRGGKVQSSSWLLKRHEEYQKNVKQT